MCRSLNRRQRTNPPRRYVAEYVAECRKVGNNRPKSRGHDRRPQGECSGLAAAPAPVPAVASPGNGEMARQHSARWIASSSERTTENWGDLTGLFPPPRAARSGDPGTVKSAVLLRMARSMRGREQNRQEPLRSCDDSWLRTIISNSSEARRLQSAGGSNSTRERVLILPPCFWRMSRSGGRES